MARRTRTRKNLRKSMKRRIKSSSMKRKVRKNTNRKIRKNTMRRRNTRRNFRRMGGGPANDPLDIMSTNQGSGSPVNPVHPAILRLHKKRQQEGAKLRAEKLKKMLIP